MGEVIGVPDLIHRRVVSPAGRNGAIMMCRDRKAEADRGPETGHQRDEPPHDHMLTGIEVNCSAMADIAYSTIAGPRLPV